MPSALTAGLAQGFASTFVPEFKSYLAGKRAARGVNAAADALGTYYGDSSLGEMFKVMGKSALMGGADPATVTTGLFQQGMRLHQEKLRYQHGIQTQNNSFGNQSALLHQRAAHDAENDARSMQFLQAQGTIFDENDARKQGRGLLETILSNKFQNRRAELEAGVRSQTNSINAAKINAAQPFSGRGAGATAAPATQAAPTLNTLLN